jgi:heat shock protein 90kDa beta
VVTKVYPTNSVLFFTDPVDDYLTQKSLSKFAGFPLQNVGKPGLKFGDEAATKEKEEAQNEKFEPLTEWLKESLILKVEDVEISTLLTSSAAAVLPVKAGLSAAQEKIMVMQNAGRPDQDAMTSYYLGQKRILQINPAHPLILALLEKATAKKTEDIKHIPEVLFETYAIGSGFDPRSPAEFVKSVESLLRQQLGVSESAKADVKVKVAAARKEKPVIDEDEEVEEFPGIVSEEDEDHYEL